MIDNPLSNIEHYRIILASGSPRRRELLQLLDLRFEVRKIEGGDESYPAEMEAQEIPRFLALKKSEEAWLESKKGENGAVDDELIITADTIVIVDGKPIGKPADIEEAREMLHQLSGRTHTVVTGVAVRTRKQIKSFSATSKVTFNPLSEKEIDFYLSHYRPLDKAGAYGIQEWIGAVAIKSIRGSFYNVMGLPVHRLYKTLKTIK